MTTKFTSGWHALALAGLVSVTVPVIAAPGSPDGARSAESGSSMPSEQYQGSVGYVTGGVGQAEAKQFERAQAKHPLAIELLERAGKTEQFTADAMVKIADRQGHTVLDAQADGPFMLVDLTPGRYSIQATLKNETLKKRWVTVARHKTAHAVFEFPGHLNGPIHLSRLEGVAEGGLGG
jgi:hypothetical protein